MPNEVVSQLYVRGNVTFSLYGYKWGYHMALFVNKGVVNKTTCWYLFGYCFVLTGRRIVYIYSNFRVWWLHQTEKGDQTHMKNLWTRKFLCLFCWHCLWGHSFKLMHHSCTDSSPIRNLRQTTRQQSYKTSLFLLSSRWCRILLLFFLVERCMIFCSSPIQFLFIESYYLISYYLYKNNRII